MSVSASDAQFSRAAVWKARLGMLACGVGALAIVLTIRYCWSVQAVNAKAPPAAAKPAPARAPAVSQIVALVNNEEITRNDLAKHCLWHYGTVVLDSLVNKNLIAEHCRTRGLTVTQQEVDAEIESVAKKFGVPVDQWLKMLKEERNIQPEQYGKDIIWPTLALRKLAAASIDPTPQELQMAKESHFGPAVRARLIACDSVEKARDVQAKARANPDDFGNLAKQYSDDINTASSRGAIQPIRRHMGDPQVERAAFGMQPGEVSQVMQVGHQYVILKCEEHIPPREPPKNYESSLRESIRESKLRDVAGDIFKKLQEQSRVEIVFNDPAKSRQMPGIAAIVNEKKLTTAELADECIARHGGEVLAGLISRKVLEQECKKRGITVTDRDLDAEMAHAAVLMGKVKNDGKTADLEQWLAHVKEEQGLNKDVYLYDVVWPSAALKKVVGQSVIVSDDDMKKGYEANYGPRVRCLAIVLNSDRQAREVWEMARKNNTAQHFGDLAEQYSVEASSKNLRGEVRPIQRHGGQPVMEKEAFALKPGELSQVLQVGDKWVILRCEGQTTPVPVKFEEVRDPLYKDLMEKKLRVAMANHYDKLMESSQIDNYLAKTSQSPKRNEPLRPATKSPLLQQVPR